MLIKIRCINQEGFKLSLLKTNTFERYFIGLVGTFIKYSTTWQYITFSADTGSFNLLNCLKSL